jgi:hypothetical protein
VQNRAQIVLENSIRHGVPGLVSGALPTLLPGLEMVFREVGIAQAHVIMELS